MDDGLDQVVANDLFVRLEHTERQNFTGLLGRLGLDPVLVDHILQVDGTGLSNRHLHLLGHDELQQSWTESDNIMRLFPQSQSFSADNSHLTNSTLKWRHLRSTVDLRHLFSMRDSGSSPAK